MKKRGIRGKKAQITVFIIIGIIILFVVGLFFYIRSLTIEQPSIIEEKRAPIETYISQCLEKTAQEAVVLAGDQGGFTTLPEEIALVPTRYVSVIPGTPLKTPFWYFDGNSRYPSEDRLKQELITYVEQNLDLCLLNLTPFRDEFNINEKTKPRITDVVLTDTSVVFEMDYELDIEPKAGGELITTEKFIVTLPVKLKKAFELAKDILEAENENMYFEQVTIDLMAMYPDDDIPFSGMAFECGRKIWYLADIKKKLQDVLVPTMREVRFKNTNYPAFAESNLKIYEKLRNRTYQDMLDSKLPEKPWDAYNYFHYFWDVTEEDYRDLSVAVQFRPEWGLSMLAKPSKYGVLKSQRQSLKNSILSFFCINTFHFVYDVKYPVKVMISDPNAFKGQGFVFSYAFPVQIYHNSPDRSALPVIFFDENVFRPDFCESISGRKITVVARDAFTNSEIDRVNLSYRCFDEICALGETRTTNFRFEWSGFVPQGCGGASIRAEKEGYLTTEQQFTGTDLVDIAMIPVKELNISIKKHTQTAMHLAKDLEPGEEAIVFIEAFDYDYDDFTRYIPGRYEFSRTGLPTYAVENGTLELIEGDVKYDLSIFLTKDIGGNQEMIGGWLGNWSVKASEIADSNKIVFHIVQQSPVSMEDMERVKFFEFLNNATAYQEDLKPKFVYQSFIEIE